MNPISLPVFPAPMGGLFYESTNMGKRADRKARHRKRALRARARRARRAKRHGPLGALRNALNYTPWGIAANTAKNAMSGTSMCGHTGNCRCVKNANMGGLFSASPETRQQREERREARQERRLTEIAEGRENQGLRDIARDIGGEVLDRILPRDSGGSGDSVVAPVTDTSGGGGTSMVTWGLVGGGVLLVGGLAYLALSSKK